MRCRRVRREMAVYRELDAAGRAAVQEHLADCPTCAVRFRDYQAQDRLLADLVAIGPSPQLRERVWARTIDGAGSRGRDALARQPRYSVVTRWAAVTLVLLVVLLGGGAVGASADSLPGDVLYPVKRVSEQIRLACAVRTESREAYAQGLAELRRWEAQQVVAQRREVQVQFEGRVDLVDGEGIVVDGLRVRLHPGLPGLTPPAVGSVISVQAWARDGQLAA